MDKIDCIFCSEKIIFDFKDVVRISIEYAKDGASSVRKYWAHTDCLPQELMTDG